MSNLFFKMHLFIFLLIWRVISLVNGKPQETSCSKNVPQDIENAIVDGVKHAQKYYFGWSLEVVYDWPSRPELARTEMA
ncbi:hypothetical protein OSTOST_16577 [Ostertagia ostertagi]